MLEFIKTDKFNDIFEDMCLQFPKEELKTKEHFLKLFKNGYKAYKIINNEPIGYILGLEYNDFLFIDYFAIFKKFHSKGFGSLVLEELKNKNIKGIFLEVEKPDNINQNKEKRIKFYEKNGAKRLDINYLFPTNDKNKFIEMFLYYIPIKISTPIKDDIYSLIKYIFNTIHKDIPHKNEILDKIIKS